MSKKLSFYWCSLFLISLALVDAEERNHSDRNSERHASIVKKLSLKYKNTTLFNELLPSRLIRINVKNGTESPLLASSTIKIEKLISNKNVNSLVIIPGDGGDSDQKYWSGKKIDKSIVVIELDKDNLIKRGISPSELANKLVLPEVIDIGNFFNSEISIDEVTKRKVVMRDVAELVVNLQLMRSELD